jgi:hypothetical protein
MDQSEVGQFWIDRDAAIAGDAALDPTMRSMAP